MLGKMMSEKVAQRPVAQLMRTQRRAAKLSPRPAWPIAKSRAMEPAV